MFSLHLRRKAIITSIFVFLSLGSPYVHGHNDPVVKQYFGSLVPWQDVERLFPRKSIFSITDFETGLTFRVQRRAGSAHADVQPLTKEDTKIMKQIYEGNWSWKRRAIVAHIDNTFVAASMNGMPHGGDGIPGNDFSGHFCVHFYGSTTHRSSEPDLAHQMMVYKSAGKLREFFDQADPETLAKSFVEAMNQQDIYLLTSLSKQLDANTFSFIMHKSSLLESVKIKQQKTSHKENHIIHDEHHSEIKLPIVLFQRHGDEQNSIYHFILHRKSNKSPWHIVDILTDENKGVKDR